MSDNNLSHQKSDGSLAKIIAAKQEKISARSHLTYVTVDQQLELLDQLTQCECGRFFLKTRGLNGFWTHYVVTYPEIRHLALPPGLATPPEWNLAKINLQEAQLQKLLFSDILEFKWQTFRSEKQAILLLQQAGFENIKILYDEAHIFPNLIGTKN